jgi:hypothetical protein
LKGRRKFKMSLNLYSRKKQEASMVDEEAALLRQELQEVRSLVSEILERLPVRRREPAKLVDMDERADRVVKGMATRLTKKVKHA